MSRIPGPHKADRGSELQALLSEVASATSLREGEEGVRAIMSAVGKAGALPIRDLAQRIRIPVPVVAAVRRELEKRDLLDRKGGLALSEKGRLLIGVEADTAPGHRCPSCEGDGFILPEEFRDLAPRFESLARDRPPPDKTLDQSHTTTDTSIRRALFLREYGALDRDLLILGDDNLTSLAVGLLRKAVGVEAKLSVVEIDQRVVTHIRTVSEAEGFGVEVLPHDLRNPLPETLSEQFDVFFTDPPYTLEGLGLFVSRGISGLRKGGGRQAFIAFGHKDPEEQKAVVQTISDAGLSIGEMRPGFNRYEGAQVLAGVSSMIRAVTTPHSAAPEGRYDGALYTADR